MAIVILAVGDKITEKRCRVHKVYPLEITSVPLPFTKFLYQRDTLFTLFKKSPLFTIGGTFWTPSVIYTQNGLFKNWFIIESGQLVSRQSVWVHFFCSRGEQRRGDDGHARHVELQAKRHPRAIAIVSVSGHRLLPIMHIQINGVHLWLWFTLASTRQHYGCWCCSLMLISSRRHLCALHWTRTLCGHI